MRRNQASSNRCTGHYWEGGSFGDAGSCILTADDRLIVWGGRGRLALVDTAKHSPAAYKELAMIDNVFSTDVWPHVVVSNGRIFCKDRLGNLNCFEIVRPVDIPQTAN